MFYNVENFFDTYDDPLTDDDEFLPGGLRRWTYDRYINKINSLYKTIIGAGSWEPPAIVAMYEIENRKVLEDLINRTYLTKFDYGIVHEDSPDRRGIDVCMIYNNIRIKILYFKYWVPDSAFNSRSVLYAKIVASEDTLHLIINHWPSRRGGVLNGEATRKKIASMIRNKIDSIYLSAKTEQKIVVAGDFNCTPDDSLIGYLKYSEIREASLTNLSDSLAAQGDGTYRYQGTWEMIDQVLVSRSLTKRKKGLFTGIDGLRIFRAGYLMRKDPKYPGLTPLPTYSGYRYSGGFSDHLPVLLDLQVK